MENYKCTICFRNIKTKSSKILLNEKFVTKCKCKYYYHERCIKNWMKVKKTCPICRKTIFDNKYDMYKILMKNFCCMTKEIFFVCTPIFFSLIALLFLNLGIFTTTLIRRYLMNMCYIFFIFTPIIWSLSIFILVLRFNRIDYFHIINFYRIIFYRINFYIY